MKRTVIVQCHGVFDILHLGHLRHLRASKSLGDCLVVSLTRDEFVGKGPGRPVFNQHQRREMLMALKNIVDTVLFADGPDEAIRMVHPDIYCKGREYEGRLPEQKLVESLGGKVVFTDEIVFSSTALVKHL